MNNLTQNHVEEYKKSINMMLFKPEDNLKERSSLYWNEIHENSFFFDRKFKLSEQLKNITVYDIKKAYRDIFINNPQKLSIQVKFLLLSYSLETRILHQYQTTSKRIISLTGSSKVL